MEKKQNTKPELVEMIDYMGLIVRRCPTKEKALKIILDDIRKEEDYYSEYFGIALNSVTLDKIAEERAYYHKKCFMYTVGDRECCECGETSGTNGRKVFTFYCV